MLTTLNFSNLPDTSSTTVETRARRISNTTEDETTLRQVARDFESLLLTQITSSLRTKTEDDDQAIDGSSTDLSQQILAEQVAEVIAKNGGVGLVNVFMDELAKQKQELKPKTDSLSNTNDEINTRPRRVFSLDEKENSKQETKNTNNTNNINNISNKLPVVKSLGKPTSINVANKVNKATNLEKIILQTSQKHGVDPYLVAAVIKQESGGRQFAVSSRGASGYMQLMPGTFREFAGVGKNIFDPQDNIDAGVKYLKFLMNQYNGDIDKVLAGYNAGPANVNKYGGIPPFKETQKFVEKVKDQQELLARNNILSDKNIAKNHVREESKKITVDKLVNNHNNVRVENIVLKSSNIIKPNNHEIINNLHLPVEGKVSSKFGVSRSHGTHKGIDISARQGTDIQAAGDGEVIFSGWQKGYGKTLLIQHQNGQTTRYAHAENLFVVQGQHVKAGQKIATVGSTGNSTGPHLHFEVIENGQAVNPLEVINNDFPQIAKTVKPIIENKENTLPIATVLGILP